MNTIKILIQTESAIDKATEEWRKEQMRREFQRLDALILGKR